MHLTPRTSGTCPPPIHCWRPSHHCSLDVAWEQQVAGHPRLCPCLQLLILGTRALKSGGPPCQQSHQCDCRVPSAGAQDPERCQRGADPQARWAVHSATLMPPKRSSTIPNQYQSCNCKLRIPHGQQWGRVGEGATPDFPCISRSVTPARQTRGQSLSVEARPSTKPFQCRGVPMPDPVSL
ncbi:hypothetical protein P7K49_037588 [Saguinus oedipus]|uniref:Uncharacterized protein n=1 Tax=Saguinus oedipus TaxID=9490 RepID=A0ABQ9TIZ5_SAGOE|nr:hypothetical protein P7K49_037588 [Saguinus oedipus]